MSQVSLHKRQATRNEDFYNSAKGSNFYEWAAVGLFYSALHYVDGYLTHKLRRPKNHRERHKIMALESNLKKIFDEYNVLFKIGWNVRYYFQPVNESELNKIYTKEYSIVKNHLLSILPTK